MDLLVIEQKLSSIILLFAHMLEIFGATVIIYAGTAIFWQFLRTSKDGRTIRLSFARFLVFGLEFKLAGEILRTVVVRTLDDVLILGSIILLRAALNLIIHWEIRQEKQDRDN